MKLSSIGSMVANGNIALALVIALAAGVLSFVSPCILPLVPGYLAYISGVTVPSSASKRRPKMALGVLLFIAGFSAVYVTFTLVFSVAGLYLIPWTSVITRIAGLIVILMGIVFLGQFGFMQRIIKPTWATRTGLIGAPLLGVIFALGWAPCSGPTLSVVLSLSLSSGSPERGILLGIAYCLGVGVPFLLVALGLNWVSNSVIWVKRHVRSINLVGGVAMIVIGALMVIGLWQILISQLGSVLPGYIPLI